MPSKKVKVIKSARRRKTVEARREGGTLVVRVPASMSTAETRQWVERMVDRVERSEDLQRLNGTRALQRRAEILHQRYFDGRPAFDSIRYVANQRGRYGSCTPEDGTIRISRTLADEPDWVRDYVIVHELAHLRIADHSKAFWRLVARYPQAERARGYLIAKGQED